MNPELGEINMNDEHHMIMHIIPDEERMSSNYLTLEEETEARGIRVTQIEGGAPVFTDVEGFTDPIEMARKELLDKKSPLILIREMRRDKTGRYVELWKVNEMTLPRSRQEIIRLTNKQMAEQLGTAAPQIAEPKKKMIKVPKNKPSAAKPKKKPSSSSKKKPGKKKGKGEDDDDEISEDHDSEDHQYSSSE